jgi:hypothetical protein
MMVLLAALETASAAPATFHQTYTIHPLGPLAGVYQISGEWRTADKVGVMASPRVVYKKYKDDEGTELTTSSLDSTTDLEELGFGATLQGRYYLFGTFPTGLFLAGVAGGMWHRVRGTIDGASARAESATMLFGPVAGGKVSFPFGLALDGDVGIAFTETLRSVSVGEVEELAGSSFRANLLVEIRAGWSF